MLRRLLSKNSFAGRVAAAAAARWPLIAICLVLLAIGGLVQYQRHLAALAAEQAEDEEEERGAAAVASPPPEPIDHASSSPSPTHPPPPPRPRRKGREVYAAWYDVPDESLAKRRAGARELTAAHNRLAIGTLVRITHLKNGKSVLVRITDRGIRDRRVKIDVCKEAAEELDMVRKGIMRVRMEVVPEDHGAAPADAHTAAPHP